MRYLIAALLTTACADDIATRDYTVATCPARFAVDDPMVCDRGPGAAIRFATVARCVADLEAAIPSTWSLSSTHPDEARCHAATGALLVTLDDVRRSVGR